MKKLIFVFACILLCSYTPSPEREDYFVFSFDDYSLAVGFDDVEYLKLVFDVEVPEVLGAGESLNNLEMTFWGRYFGDVDIANSTDKEIPIDQAVITGLDLYLPNVGMETYKLGDTQLSSSVKENCQMFHGEYIERNGYACVITRQIEDQLNVVILHGDILNMDQDELARIEIYVE